MSGNQDRKSYRLTEGDMRLVKRQAALQIAEAAIMSTVKAALSAAKQTASEKIGQEMLKQVGDKLSASLEKAKKDAAAAVKKYVKNPKEAEEVASQALMTTLQKTQDGMKKTSSTSPERLNT